MRFVGFASNHQKMLEDFLKKKQPIEVRNCQIKKSTCDSDKLELLVKGATKILPSPKNLTFLMWNFNRRRLLISMGCHLCQKYF